MRVNTWDSSARPDPDAERGENASGEIVPIESAISARDTKNLHRQAELSAEIIEERQKRAAEPVHLEGLKPLPPEIRAQLPGPGEIPGGPNALGLAPSMRRAVPPPYQRDRIAIDHHGRTWAYAAAETVQKDDIVVDFGKVVQVASVVKYKDVGEIGEGNFRLKAAYEFTGGKVAVGTEIRLVNIADEMRSFDPDEQLRVFRVHENGGG